MSHPLPYHRNCRGKKAPEYLFSHKNKKFLTHNFWLSYSAFLSTQYKLSILSLKFWIERPGWHLGLCRLFPPKRLRNFLVKNSFCHVSNHILCFMQHIAVGDARIFCLQVIFICCTSHFSGCFFLLHILWSSVCRFQQKIVFVNIYFIDYRFLSITLSIFFRILKGTVYVAC